MDFSETPAAKVDTTKPRFKDFIGQRIRITAGQRHLKTRKDGQRYAAWSLTFDVRQEDRNLRYTVDDASYYAIDAQLCAIMTESRQIDPRYLAGGGLVCWVVPEGNGAKLSSTPPATATETD